MYNRSTNPQVIYSLDALSDALFSLLQEHNLNEITISEICSHTTLNRRTYYRNCEEILDLVYYKIDKLVKGNINIVDWYSRDERKLYIVFFNYWYGNKEILSILKKRELFGIFLIRFKKIVNDIMYPFLQDIIDNNGKENIKYYYNSYIIGGLANVLECWVEHGFDIDIDKLVDMICLLTPLH